MNAPAAAIDLFSYQESTMTRTPPPAPSPAPRAVIFSPPPAVDPATIERNRATMRERDAQRAAEREAFLDLARPRFPAWAAAVIVAELIHDESDSMTDYYGGRTLRTVILGYSRHTRDLFPEMRAAAATFAETAELATAPESAEHRQKYSMGGGYFLKLGSRYSSGWQVRKRRASTVEQLPTAEFAPDPTPDDARELRSATAPAGTFRVEEHYHTKRACPVWIAVSVERVERDVFEAQRAAAKLAGGWYSRAWGKVPGGFAFASEGEARAFAGDVPADAPAAAATIDTPAPAAAATGSSATADKLRQLADGLQPAIDDKFADRRRNTPKQQRQAAEARLEGVRLERTQTGLRALAALHDAGTVPAVLSRVTTKAAAYALAASRIERSGGYYDAGVDSGEPSKSTPDAVAFWALLKPLSPEQRAAEELRRKVDALRFANIAGFFPTPAPLVARMIAAADLSPGARVLEPSAGSGAIADALRDAGHKVECVERHATLCDILRGKGHDVTQGDFAELPGVAASFDAVVMNPPFEKAQDVAHVRHAWEYVKPGGSLVAIMGAGVGFRTDRAYADFRAFVDAHGGTIEPIPAGAFAESGTGVASVLVVLAKGEA